MSEGLWRPWAASDDAAPSTARGRRQARRRGARATAAPPTVTIDPAKLSRKERRRASNELRALRVRATQHRDRGTSSQRERVSRGRTTVTRGRATPARPIGEWMRERRWTG